MNQFEKIAKGTQGLWSKSNHAQKKQEFFRAHYKALGFDQVGSCISIGAGKYGCPIGPSRWLHFFLLIEEFKWF